MPSLNYQERFVPFIRDGSKPHTIRARRKRPIKAGDTLFHFTGLRTTACQRIAQDKCLVVNTILITAEGNVVIFKKRLQEIPEKLSEMYLNFNFKRLNERDRDQLAWLDGFRPDGSSLDDCKGCFEVMFRWFRRNHDLPFVGDIIYRDLPGK